MNKKQLVIIAGVLMITTLVYGVKGKAADEFSEAEWASAVESVDRSLFYAPYFTDGEYFNPWMQHEIGLGKVLKWRFLSDRQKYSEEEESFLPDVKDLTADHINTSDNFMSWIGHSSVVIKSSGTVLLVDPVFGDIPYTEKRKTRAALSYGGASRITGDIIVLFTHNHYDHLDKKSIRSLPKRAMYIVPAGLAETLRGFGCSNVREMDWWEETRIKGNKIVFLPSQHWSKRGPFDTNESLWGSFLVDTGTKKIFICGDGGYSLVYREISARYPGIDYAFMSAGAFHPRWFMHYAHQDDYEAIKGFTDLRAKKMIPFHWGAFRLGDEPAGYPAIHIKRKFPEALILPCGEIIRI